MALPIPSKRHIAYRPEDHYWLHADGRVFSSAKRAVIKPDDPVFVAWKAAGGVPTRWPRDDAGEQTDAALHEVLSPHGIGVGIDGARDAALAEVMAHYEAASFTGQARKAIQAVTDPAKLAAVVAGLKATIDKTASA